MDGTDSLARPSRRGTAVAIGNFDGVHLGHRLLVSRAIEAAVARGLRSMVLTFDRHPATILRPDRAPRLLTGVDDKLALLRETGVDEVRVLRFDEARAAESAEDFVQSVLVGEIGAEVVAVGATFRFGHRQGGDVSLLEAMGHTCGFEVLQVDLVEIGAAERVPVSSSRIRELVASGEVEAASELLGRNFVVRALVVDRPSPDVDGGGRGYACTVSRELLVPAAGTYLGTIGRTDNRRGAVTACPATVSVVGERVCLVARVDAGAWVEERDAPRPGDDVEVAFVARVPHSSRALPQR